MLQPKTTEELEKLYNDKESREMLSQQDIEYVESLQYWRKGISKEPFAEKLRKGKLNN